MAEVIGERFENWQGEDFDEDTLEPSEVAQAIMEDVYKRQGLSCSRI